MQGTKVRAGYIRTPTTSNAKCTVEGQGSGTY